MSLADSQVLRWLDELNGVVDGDARAVEIKREIRALRKEENSLTNRKRIRQLYDQLDEIQFKPDYLCVIMDKEKDYRRACRGFSINGIRYFRLLGTNGGVKNSTIVFASERWIDELRRRIDNGRDLSKELVPAKLEAYRALTCSASTPVSLPRGVIVVPDCETEFFSDIIYLSDENTGEPQMDEKKQEKITLDESDGYGLMLPSLAQRWSDELRLGYVASGVNTRFCWEKGMVFSFDFRDFAEKVAGSTKIVDAWGVERDVMDAELILTTSMLKLWDSYQSCESYLENCDRNGYSFCITKVCPEALEHERTLNYQFIQSYDLRDEEIEQLIGPTVSEIRDILFADPVKTALYLNGIGLNDSTVRNIPQDYVKAALIEPMMIDDPYIQSKIYHLIRNRINDAKVGVLNVHGNYSIIGGDPYALCQSMFGLPVTGLLKAGEIYNEYWSQCGAERLACYRAPMTSMHNVRIVKPNRSAEAAYWFRHLHTCTLMNAWDTAAAALNGADKDGDLVMLTDNEVLVSRAEELPALMCVQRKAAKIVPTENDLVQSNINSFGDDIGRTTNYITSMFEVRSRYPKDSEEYTILTNRIRFGQLYQQNCIDKAKGILCKPMPRAWYDRHEAAMTEEEDKRDMMVAIAADRKPYFMRYIYPSLMKKYNTYVKNSNKSAIREFGMSLDNLLAMPETDRTERQQEFIKFYTMQMPVGMGDCVVNRICRRIEDEFDGYLAYRRGVVEFDYSIMKSGAEYSKTQFTAVKRLLENYERRRRSQMAEVQYVRTDSYDLYLREEALREEFVSECAKICPDRFALCDIVLDLCYQTSSLKSFAWTVCGEEIVENLLRRNDRRIAYPTQDEHGDIFFGGHRFSIRCIQIEEEDI